MERGWPGLGRPARRRLAGRGLSVRWLLFLQRVAVSLPGMDAEKLERIQLPVPSAAEKTIYNHLLAERLIRIMNNAAQPGAWGALAVHRGGCCS